ncbi:hypothetical protein Ddye_004885 [Dipteronia dyeriana]|uniref:Nuclease HARBI1 n=1 Tax=Dipteronia dyeriana TaxID=168575 RepID=A0AAD9XFM4_9ROSI|nr:hypothetical protein Ddye_004885 [Dipteronia dyeriana]
MQMLAYGITVDVVGVVDEYVRIGENTTIESLKINDIARLLAEGEHRGFPGMLGSIDYMHWTWKNCQWHGKGYLFEGRGPLVNYYINGHHYTMGYYLSDGIYPPWSTLVKTIPYPQENKHKNFAKAQESTRKDVERALRVLQPRFAIVRGPANFWGCDTLNHIMKACVIMHNMIIENERGIDIEDLNDMKVMKILRLNHHLNTQ